jgi:hypothetical protein
VPPARSMSVSDSLGDEIHPELVTALPSSGGRPPGPASPRSVAIAIARSTGLRSQKQSPRLEGEPWAPDGCLGLNDQPWCGDTARGATLP